jgi:eukaryotic-like serine/threonine-protein kinase
VSPRVAALVSREALDQALGAVQRLEHPCIVPMYEHGWSDEVPFYVLARGQGTTLREYLERERQLPVGEAVQIADEIAGALAFAHGRGVLHGDLRSKHVQLAPGDGAAAGHAAIKSFGIVNAIAATAGGKTSSTVVQFGSPAYLSPEQLAGERAANERTDVYSLGCILYEMLAGEVPFQSASQMMLVSAKLTQPAPSARVVRDSVPPELDDVVRRSLARLPSDRFRTAAEFREALGRVRVAP